MSDILQQLETSYIDTQALLCFLHEYQKPREWIRRKVDKGELIRLKNGFFLIRSKIQQGKQLNIPYEQVANLLYGPSYVSLEWALSFYGLIPERVHSITSMTLGRAKLFTTPVGDFSYSFLRTSAYSIGVNQKESPDFVGGFLIASPEKALADLVFKYCKGLDKNQLKDELLESRRMDQERLRQIDKRLLMAIAEAYESPAVDNLMSVLVRL